MGVFLDGVETRSSALFTQCVGRVLRKEKSYNKINGVIVDFCAKNGMDLCDRVGEYLQLPSGSMPWKFKKIILEEKTLPVLYSLTLDINKNLDHYKTTTIDEENVFNNIENYYIRKLPNNKEYIDRKNIELKLIIEKKLEIHLYRAIQILNLVGKDVPHVTRGSCGSSLVCYLLGISNVDPIKHNICFSRFLNEYRKNLPDIDFDFPYNYRADIFLKMAIKWSGTIARISNHVYYHEPSALRAALRKHSHKSMIRVADLHNYLNNLSSDELIKINQTAERINGEFNCYSLHCGGVVYYPDGIPNEDLLDRSSGRLLPQVLCDKNDISDKKQFKIDILSSRALAQLYDTIPNIKEIQIDSPPFNDDMIQLFSTGNNIGITLAESPLIRQEFKNIKPKSVEDIAKCLSLIRPAARQSQCNIIYDDDAIKIISNLLNCDEALADYYRRGLSKNKKEIFNELAKKIGKDEVEKLKNAFFV